MQAAIILDAAWSCAAWKSSKAYGIVLFTSPFLGHLQIHDGHNQNIWHFSIQKTCLIIEPDLIWHHVNNTSSWYLVATTPLKSLLHSHKQHSSWHQASLFSLSLLQQTQHLTTLGGLHACCLGVMSNLLNTCFIAKCVCRLESFLDSFSLWDNEVLLQVLDFGTSKCFPIALSRVTLYGSVVKKLVLPFFTYPHEKCSLPSSRTKDFHLPPFHLTWATSHCSFVKIL